MPCSNMILSFKGRQSFSVALDCECCWLDRGFDHIRLGTVWKQCEQEHAEASFSDKKAPKSQQK